MLKKLPGLWVREKHSEGLPASSESPWELTTSGLLFSSSAGSAILSQVDHQQDPTVPF